MSGLEHATPGVVLFLLFAGYLLGRELLRIRSGYHHYIRRIPGVDAIEGAVGRCAELGRPTMFSTGLTDISPVLYACLGVLHFVAKKAAQFKLKLFVPQYTPEAMAIVEDTTREAYRDAGRANDFDPQSIVFLSGEQFAYASGYMGLMHREKAGAAFLFGAFAAEALVLAEAGQQVGARQVAASVSPEQVAFFICTCDYTLIGEELFGASAYMSREPVQVATLASQDRLKLLILSIMLVGVAVATLRSLLPEVVVPSPELFFTTSWSELFGWLSNGWIT